MVVNLSQSLLQVSYHKEVFLVHSFCHFLYKFNTISQVTYIDLHDSIKSNVHLSADDGKIYKSINSLNDHDILWHDILQHDIDNLAKWSSDWLLKLNPNKCNVWKVVKNTLMDSDYIMQSYLAVHIPGEKLGVIFNSRLSIDAHISDKVSKASKILGLIRAITILNQVTLEQLYKAS